MTSPPPYSKYLPSVLMEVVVDTAIPFLTSNKYVFYLLLVVLSVVVKLPYILNLHGSYHGRWNSNKYLNLFQRLMFAGTADFARYWNGYELHTSNVGDTLLYDDIISSKSSDNSNSDCNNKMKRKLLVGYHSRPTLDLVYLVANLQPKSIVFRFLFDIPVAGNMIHELGGMPSATGTSGSSGGSSEMARVHFIDEIKKSNRPVMVLPGGVFELSKLYDDRFKVAWKEAGAGFAQAITGSKTVDTDNICVIPFYTRNCEISYYAASWWYDYTGRSFRSLDKSIRAGKFWYFPVYFSMVFLMLGFLIIPSPVKLDTYFADPMYAKKGESADVFSKRVKDSLQDLMTKSESLPERPFTQKRNLIKSIAWGSLAIFQNLVFGSILLISIWIASPLLIIYSFIFKKKKKKTNMTTTTNENKKDEAIDETKGEKEKKS